MPLTSGASSPQARSSGMRVMPILGVMVGILVVGVFVLLVSIGAVCHCLRVFLTGFQRHKQGSWSASAEHASVLGKNQILPNGGVLRESPTGEPFRRRSPRGGRRRCPPVQVLWLCAT